MNRVCKLAVLILLPILLVTAYAGDQKNPALVNKPVADPLRVMMENKGYVAIPLIQLEGDSGFLIECKSGAETFRMLLDTGATGIVMDTGLVKKLGLKHKMEVIGFDFAGSQKGAKVSVRGLSLGEFDSRTVANSTDIAAFDFTSVNSALEVRKVPRIDGLLGHTHLELYSAVIDYSTQTLYMRTPLRGLWPEIEGRWVATSGQEDGRERKIDPDNPLRLEFKDRRFHLTDKVVDILYGMHVRPDKDFYTVSFFDPEEELAKELNYKAGTLLKVKDGKLTLCLCLSPAVAKGVFPSDFKAPAGSGHIVLEFRRDK